MSDKSVIGAKHKHFYSKFWESRLKIRVAINGIFELRYGNSKEYFVLKYD